MFELFYHFASLPHRLSSFFVSLIPKAGSPFQLGYFLPISLLGSPYKLQAKVFVGRLTSVMDKLISFNQSTSLKVDS